MHDRDSGDNDSFATDNDELMDRNLTNAGINNKRRRTSDHRKSTTEAISSLDVLHDF
jgi:hypothetical protein